MPDEPFSRGHSPNPERAPATPLPVTETQQPDPFLQTSTGRMGAGGITIATVAVAIILGVVLYGLNERTAAESTAAPHSTTAGQQPSAGGTSSAATPGAPRANESGVKG
ncbi:MAG: hypothetical protein WA851_27310 [Xanthobacteraceae bacterium]